MLSSVKVETRFQAASDAKCLERSETLLSSLARNVGLNFFAKDQLFSTEATQGVGYDLMSSVLIGKLISWHCVERRIELQCLNYDSNCAEGCLGALFAASLDANLRGP